MSRRRDEERPIDAARGPFAVECPACREPVGVGRELVGRVAGCPRCRNAFVVPQPDHAGTGGRVAASREPAAAPRPHARPPDHPPVVERSAPAPSRAPTIEEPVAFSDPPVPVARIRAGQAPAAATVEPATSTSTWDATAVATPASPVQAPPTDERDPPTTPATNLAFRDPVKTIHSGNTTIEIRRLTPEEKRSRQARRNLLMLLVGAALLVALVVVLGAGR